MTMEQLVYGLQKRHTSKDAEWRYWTLKRCAKRAWEQRRDGRARDLSTAQFRADRAWEFRVRNGK
jgi:hypothetical protein